MRIAIVIVNYRSAELAIACLRSLAPEVFSIPGLQTVVVDNASGDGSGERIAAAIAREGWDGWARVLPLEQNRGFAAGNNAGIALLLAADNPPEYVLLLNPDTLVQAGAIGAVVQFLDTHPRAGIAGSHLLDPDGEPQSYAKRFPCLLAEMESGLRLGIVTRLLAGSRSSLPPAEHPHTADWVSGAAFCVRRELLQQVGQLDEGFFLYYEEVDYCRRARIAGWEVWTVPASRIVHLEGKVTNLHRPQKPLPRYWYESRRRYYCKHHGKLYAVAAEVAFQFGYMTWRLRRWIQRKPDTDPCRRLRDGWRHVALPSLLGH